MATTIGELLWKIKGDTSDIDKSTQKTESKIGKLGKAMIAAFTGAAVIAGIKKLASFLKSTGEAAAVQESAIVRLGAALDVTGQAGGGALAELQEFASELQAITVVGDETTLALLQTAINMGLTKDEAKTAAEQAIALSRAYGIDLNTALIGVTNTIQGQTSTLTRYIPSLKTATNETERMAILNEEAAKAMAVAREEVNTAAGAQQQLANAIGDSHELTGNYVNDILTPWRQRLTEIITELNNARAAQQNLDAALAGEGTANVLAAVDEQKKKVEELRDAISEGGRAAQTIAREYQVSIRALDQILRQEESRLIGLSDIADQQRIAANAEGEERQNALDAIAAEEERLRLIGERAERLIEQQELERELLQGRQDAADEADIRASEEAELWLVRKNLIDELKDLELEAIEEIDAARRASALFTVDLATETFNNLAGIFKEESAARKAALIAGSLAERSSAAFNAFLSTQEAAAKALTAGPILGPILAGIMKTLGFINIGAILAKPLPKLADGGIVPATPGGRAVRVAEGGRDEAIVPLDQAGGFGSTTFNLIMDSDIIASTTVDKINAGQFTIFLDRGTV